MNFKFDKISFVIKVQITILKMFVMDKFCENLTFPKELNILNRFYFESLF